MNAIKMPAKLVLKVLRVWRRPFTAKWHKLSLDGAFELAEQRQVFRQELKALQIDLKNYAQVLADIAQVEDLTGLAFD
jgi:hypothetical protein